MNQSDLLFLTIIAIMSTSLVVLVVQFVRSRRRGPGAGEGDGRAGWWEGPWEDDDRRR